MSTCLARLLERRSPVHIRWGLERTEAMLAALGDPHTAFSVIHVAGTNGKGSTGACAESILRTSGCRTGLYTSPHLEAFSERIRIDGQPADERLLQAVSSDLLPLAEREDATFFEAATVLAFETFRRAGCETIVAEVGLGGRLDSTNVVSPTVTVITSVDLDHIDYLGNTLEEIAAEKAGILKADVPAVVGPLSSKPLDVVLNRASEVGAHVDLLGRDIHIDDVDLDLDGTSFTYRGPGSEDGWSLHTPLIGLHQAANAALAVRSVQVCHRTVSRRDVIEGLETVRWPGRFEISAGRDGTWVLDLAHNVPAVASLAELLKSLPLPRPLVALVAILGDKPWRDMLDPLLSAASAAVFTVAPSSPAPRRWNPGVARQIIGEGRIEVDTEFETALARARELAGTGTVVVTGSAHTVGDARKRIRDREAGIHEV